MGIQQITIKLKTNAVPLCIYIIYINIWSLNKHILYINNRYLYIILVTANTRPFLILLELKSPPVVDPKCHTRSSPFLHTLPAAPETRPPRALRGLINLYQAWLDFRAWQTQLQSALRHASRRPCLEMCRQETCQIVYTWVMTNVDSENEDNSETAAVLSAYVMLYPNSTNSKSGTKHTLPMEISQLALCETICDAKQGIFTPIASAGLGDQSVFSNTQADSQAQALLLSGYQPSLISSRHFNKQAATKKRTPPKTTNGSKRERKGLVQVAMGSSGQIHYNFCCFPSLFNSPDSLFHLLMFLLLLPCLPSKRAF